MFIKALCDYYDYLAEQGEVQEPGFEQTPIHYLIMLKPSGEIADIVDVHVDVKIPNAKNPEKFKVVKRPVMAKMPTREQTTGPNAKAYRLDHRAKYIFGMAYDKKNDVFEIDSAKSAHDRFLDRNVEFIEGVNSSIVAAYRNFLKSWIPENETENRHLITVLKSGGKGTLDSVNFGFALDGHPELTLHEDPGVVAKIRAEAREAGDGEQNDVCAVTGQKGRYARLHRDLKGIVGQKAGVLVCVKDSAGESYGKEQAYTSNITEETVMKYTEAFNILTARKDATTQQPTNKIAIGDTTVVFFATAKDSEEVDWIMRGMSVGNNGETAEKVQTILQKMLDCSKQGKPFDWEAVHIDPNTDYYVFGLTPNSSRISLKFAYKNKARKILDNLAMHQNDMALDGTKYPASIYAITEELKSPKATDDKVAPTITAKLFDGVVMGYPYPQELLAAVMRRIKTDQDDPEKGQKFIKINSTRIGIIKACLNRKCRFQNQKEEITMSLDTTNTNPGYVCGRLFAMLEWVQREALRDVNSSIKDKYFASACTRPAVVFPRLVSLSQAHLAKIDDKKRPRTSAAIGNIIDLLNAEFPTVLSLEDQGRFAIGYYQQNQQIYRKHSESGETDAGTEKATD